MIKHNLEKYFLNVFISVRFSTTCMPAILFFILFFISKSHEFLIILFSSFFFPLSFLLIALVSLSLDMICSFFKHQNTRNTHRQGGFICGFSVSLFVLISFFVFFLPPSLHRVLHICLSYLFAVWCYPRNQSKHWTTAALLTQYLPVFLSRSLSFSYSLPSFPACSLLIWGRNWIAFFFSLAKCKKNYEFYSILAWGRDLGGCVTICKSGAATTPI